MKRRIIWLTSVLLSVLLGIFIGNIKNEEENINSRGTFKNKRALSMMLETGAGTGVYEQTTRSTWPTDGYVFNSELSNCENGGILSWDSETENVIMVSDKSDKCYVYFDVYNSVLISEVTLSSTSNSITVNVSATSGTSSISKYYYSKDNGLSYEESTESEYTFSNLTRGTNYKIKVYVKDSNEVSSKIVSKEIETKNSVLLADYIKSLYTTQGANGLYLHNSSLANSANDGSYRYAGPSDEVNNYVCFGSDAESCPNDNLYRIIGVFGDKVKLIKYDYATSTQLGTNGAYYGIYSYGSDNYKGHDYSNIAGYYWTSSSNSSNIWSKSALNTTNLNGTYLSNLASSWTNKITTSTWKVGGNTYSNIYSVSMYQTYQNEIVSPAENTTHQAKIGLMYVSDYGYAASPTYWTYKGYNSNDSTNDYRAAVNDNWMYMGLYEWTISRRSDYSSHAFRVDGLGSIANGYVHSQYYAVRPCFYLNSNVLYNSGDGTKLSPMTID